MLKQITTLGARAFISFRNDIILSFQKWAQNEGDAVKKYHNEQAHHILPSPFTFMVATQIQVFPRFQGVVKLGETELKCGIWVPQN